MMRVIAGCLRGRTILTPRGEQTRPTLSRIRQSLFDRIQPVLAGATCLDLFAGSGALGIEALSRGAAACWFVEKDPRALACLRANLVRLCLVEQGRVLSLPVERFLRSPAGLMLDVRFHIVFADPPYLRGLVQPTLQGLSVFPALAAGAWLIVQHSPREELGVIPPNIDLIRSDRYGETVVSLLQVRPEARRAQHESDQPSSVTGSAGGDD